MAKCIRCDAPGCHGFPDIPPMCDICWRAFKYAPTTSIVNFDSGTTDRYQFWRDLTITPELAYKFIVDWVENERWT